MSTDLQLWVVLPTGSSTFSLRKTWDTLAQRELLEFCVNYESIYTEKKKLEGHLYKSIGASAVFLLHRFSQWIISPIFMDINNYFRHQGKYLQYSSPPLCSLAFSCAKTFCQTSFLNFWHLWGGSSWGGSEQEWMLGSFVLFSPTFRQSQHCLEWESPWGFKFCSVIRRSRNS